MKAVRVYLLILATVLLSFNVSFAQTEPVKADPQPIDQPILKPQSQNEKESYRIGFEDTIEVEVYNQDKLSKKYSVNTDGTINLFRSTKPVMAICKTERELAAEIEKEYLNFLKKPEVKVIVTEKKSQAYGVIGAVEKPANYYGVRRIRLLELLAMAGGPNEQAGSRLIVARTGSTSACRVESDDSVIENDLVLMNFKVKDILEAKQNLWMQPGDIVSVLDADVVYLWGNVNKIGPVKMKEPITLTQAIVTAEGLRPTAKSKIRVLRLKPGTTEREELVYDIKEIEKRRAQDPVLQPDDIVAVSEDSTKAVLKGVTDVLRNGLPTLFYRIP